MGVKRALLLGVVLLLAGCSAQAEAEAEPSAQADVMTYGYLQSVHEQGATGMTDEQLLVAGQVVCAEFGNMARPGVPYATRSEAYGVLYDRDLIPEAAGHDTVNAILNSTSFLCLHS